LLRILEPRPTPVFFISVGPLQTRIVEKPVCDLFPDSIATIKSDRIDGLDFHDPLAAPAGDPQHMTLDFRQFSLPHSDAIAVASVLQKRIVFVGKGRIRSCNGRCWMLDSQLQRFSGRHAPACRSVGHAAIRT
jgi:hypothetical protein